MIVAIMDGLRAFISVRFCELTMIVPLAVVTSL
jgi:hypothetical protein